jgi:LemA protein
MKGQVLVALGVIAFILVALLVVVIMYFSIYNSIIGADNLMQNKWADVEVQYNRRADLIPQVVNATRGYMQFEKTVLTDVTNARSQWESAKTDEEKMTAGSSFDSAIGRLLLVYENYPELKSDTVVRDLMAQLEGTENRIAVARGDYNDVVKDYNNKIQMFPSNIVAGMMGRTEPKAFFEAPEGSENAPPVNLENLGQ